MKIELNAKGELKVDDEKIKHEEITADFLEKVVKESLEDNVIYLLPDEKSNPIVSLFYSLKEATKENSEFRKELKELEREQDEIEKKIQSAEEDIENFNKESENNLADFDFDF